MTDLIESKLTVGDIVKSTAGRGSGRIYLVVKSLENGYVYISDGKTRKINNAKLKKFDGYIESFMEITKENIF